jgi:holo-[acyl-carrier protein] synthase
MSGGKMDMTLQLPNGDPKSPFSVVCGVDIVEIESMDRYIKAGRDRYLQRVFTPAELAFCRDRLPQLAARVAAKEAVSKALGTGMRGIGWHDIEVVSNKRGRPSISLSGRAAILAERLHLSDWKISISHSPSFAIAFVISTYRKARR